MSILQISRIQHRTGNIADLPQLSVGELGWASDERRLFIGNDPDVLGPQPDNTEIMTEFSPVVVYAAGADSQVQFNSGGAFAGNANLTFNQSTGALSAVVFTTLSDSSQKINIEKISSATNTILQVDGVEFNWKDTGNKSAGVIAQQLETVLPHLVSSTAEHKSVNYSGLIGYLIEAIKELECRISVLENKQSGSIS